MNEPATPRDRPTSIGVERRCRNCHEWWPLSSEFYERMSRVTRGGRFRWTCRACCAERHARCRTPKADTMARRVRRAGPEGEAMRARQRVASRRHYWKDPEAARARRRELYAAKLARPVLTGYGRPRIAA